MFKQPTFETFFTHEQIEDFIKNAKTFSAWDFACACGDTIKEKYEDFYVKLVELNKILLRKGAKGWFFIVTTSEIASIIDLSMNGAYTSNIINYKIHGVLPQGLPDVKYIGSVGNKWLVFSDDQLAANVLLMGCNDQVEDYSHYAKLSVANFII